MLPLIIGHRGAAGLEPENTLRSFQRALVLGVDAVETDVRVSRDGVPVCFHDENLERLTGHPNKLSSLSLEELKQLDVGQGEHIPTLAEVIRLVRGRAVLEIELKAPDSVGAVLHTLATESLTPLEVVITSFNLLLLRQVYHERPDFSLSVLYRELPQDWLDAASRVAAKTANLHFQSVTEEWVRDTHAAGLLARTWTVNNLEDMQQLIAMGVDGITTDRPDVLWQEVYRNSSRAAP